MLDNNFMFVFCIDCTDKIDFMRDIIAFMVVVGTVIGVAFDGAVSLYIHLMQGRRKQSGWSGKCLTTFWVMH